METHDAQTSNHWNFPESHKKPRGGCNTSIEIIDAKGTNIKSAITALTLAMWTAGSAIGQNTLKLGTVCSGAAMLDNGSIVMIGQPFAGARMVNGGGGTGTNINPGSAAPIASIIKDGGPVSLSVSQSPGSGMVRLNFMGMPGRTYFVEASTNLSTWAQVWSASASAAGNSFTETNSVPLRKFYRTRTLY